MTVQELRELLEPLPAQADVQISGPATPWTLTDLRVTFAPGKMPTVQLILR